MDRTVNGIISSVFGILSVIQYFFFFYEGDSVFVLFFTLIKYCFSTNHGFKVVLYLINFKCVGLHVSALELALPIYNMIDLAQ